MEPNLLLITNLWTFRLIPWAATPLVYTSECLVAPLGDYEAL